MSRALDIGCAVGRSTFELATRFESVLGIDFSEAFVDRCNELKECGKSSYCLPSEGEIAEKGMAEISNEIVRFILNNTLYFKAPNFCNIEFSDVCGRNHKSYIMKFSLQ